MRHGNSWRSQDETYKCRDWAKTEAWKTMSQGSLETRHVYQDSITVSGTGHVQDEKVLRASWRRRSLFACARQVRLRQRQHCSVTQAARWRSVDRSVYSNVTVIVVVVVLVCVLCIVSPMISHLFWSLEYLLSDPKSRRIACNYRKKVQPWSSRVLFVFRHTASPCVTTQRLYTSVLLLLQVELFLSSFFRARELLHQK